MAYNGSEGEIVDLNDAAQWTETWRNEHPGANKAVFIGKDHIESLLNQSGAMGIRIYFAIGDENEVTTVLVAANSDQDDMLEMVFDRGDPVMGSNNNLNGGG